jgi:O-antigen ligase
MLTCLWTIHTAYLQQAFFEWEIQLAFLLFPFLFSIGSVQVNKYRDSWLQTLAVSCTFVVIYLYADAFRTIHFYHLPLNSIWHKTFLHHNFTQPIGLHATYFSLYAGLSWTALFCRLRTGVKQWKSLSIICLVILSAGLIQLASRSVLIGMGLVVFFIMPFQFTGRRRIIYMAGSFISALACVLVLCCNPVYVNRFTQGLYTDLSDEVTAGSAVEPRAARWAAALKVISRAPLTGHGTGSEIGLLKDQYFADHLYQSYLHELNAHNQYLSLLIKTGALGLLVYLGILFVGYRLAYQRRDWLFLSFLALVTVTGFAENILDVNKGIFFIAFFYTMFFFSDSKKEAGNRR